MYAIGEIPWHAQEGDGIIPLFESITMESKMRRLQTIPTDHIDQEDKTFLITFLPETEPLMSSIALVGLLEPLCVRERDDRRYQLICGFKRAETLHRLSISETEAFVYAAGELDDLHALLLTVGHNLTRPLNLVEKARALEKLRAFGVPEKELIDRYFPLFELQSNVRILKLVIGLADLEQGLQEYLVRKNLSLSTSALFLHLDKEDQQAILPLLETLQPGENRVKEIISSLREISLRDGVSLPSLLARNDIAMIRSDQETQRPQRIEQLRRIVKEMRFPRLVEMEQKFAEYKRSLSLPPQISFHPPPFFEGEEFRMELRFKDFKTFRELTTSLHQISEGEYKDQDPLLEISHGR
jgi:ParB-like chromosome segregation protein Spo0J